MTHADTAASLVLGDRNSDYGDPHADFAGLALMWSGLLNEKLKERITATDVALMMTALKLKRQAHKPKVDNVADAHGYLFCLEWIETGKRPLPLAHELETRVDELTGTIEDVCTGTRLNCVKCGQPRPCNCDKGS